MAIRNRPLTVTAANASRNQLALPIWQSLNHFQHSNVHSVICRPVIDDRSLCLTNINQDSNDDGANRRKARTRSTICWKGDVDTTPTIGWFVFTRFDAFSTCYYRTLQIRFRLIGNADSEHGTHRPLSNNGGPKAGSTT